VNNTRPAFATEAVAASVARARRLGLETATVAGALSGGPLVPAWQAVKLQRIARGEFSGQFALSLALKDVHLALEAADGDRFAALTCLAGEWQQAVEQGLSGQDLTAVTRARAAGGNALTLIGYTMMCEQTGAKRLVRCRPDDDDLAAHARDGQGPVPALDKAVGGLVVSISVT
jgi:hypothetical protein